MRNQPLDALLAELADTLSEAQTLPIAGRIARNLLTLFLILLALTPWQQNVRGLGRVVAYSPAERQQVISAPVDGRVSRWLVKEGSPVKQGQVIAELSDNDPLLLQRLTSEQTALLARRAAVNNRLETLRAQLRMAEQACPQALIAAAQSLEAAKAAIETAGLNLNRQQQLRGKGLASQRTLELAQLDNAQRQADILKLQTRLARQQTQTITAPRDGTVLRLLANPNAELLKAGQAMALLVPDTQARAVELWVDGNDLPLIVTGSRARLQFEGYPAIQFGGWPEFSVGSFAGQVAVIDASDDGKGHFRIMVTPDNDDLPWPDPRFLRQGVRVNGWVLLGQVTLGYELRRIFNGFPQLVLPEPGSGSPAEYGSKDSAGSEKKSP